MAINFLLLLWWALVGCAGLPSRAPQMGWNSWNTFGGNISSRLISETIQALAPLASLGYRVLVVDDGWSEPVRNKLGLLEANKARFPSGMKVLADQAHSAGLHFGMYGDAGALTCLGYPGSRGHEHEDAAFFASMETDYLKYDNCWAPASDWVVDRYTAMHRALVATGRDIFFAMCDWGVAEPWRWGPKISHSWRTTGDIASGWEHILRCLDNTVGLSAYGGSARGWNDPDMLEVGRPGLTVNEWRSHFLLWAILKAPLILGLDVRNIAPEARQIITAEEVIAVNQDSLGVPGDLVHKEGPLEVYAGPLSDDRARAVCLFNRHVSTTQYPRRNITVSWADIGLREDAVATVRDLYQRRDLGRHQGSFTAEVDIHDAVMVRVRAERGEDADPAWRPWGARYGRPRNRPPALERVAAVQASRRRRA